MKKAEHDKLYECIIKCEAPYKELNKLDEFFVNKELSQRTPTRVAHRRKDKVRKRVVYSVESEPIDELTFKTKIKAASGTYIKGFRRFFSKTSFLCIFLGTFLKTS